MALVAAADYLWDRLPVLHLGPTHDSFENADRREGWGHWRGHDDGRKTGTPCDKFLVYRRGFNATDVSHTCNIFSPPQYNGVPAYAPVEYVFDPEPTDPFHPDVLGLNVRPLAEQVQSFHWWAMDDIGLDRFIGTLEITERDLKQTADDHPSDAARILSRALLDLLQDHTAVNNDAPGPQIQHWSGHPLYDRLDEALLRHGSSICKMYAELAMADLTNKQWLNMENKADLPLNFMPELWPKIVPEMARWMKARSRPFHPHIHIVWDDPSAGGGRQSIIRVRWLKRLPLTQPILVLDATGRVDLLAKAFGIPEGLIEVTERVDTPAFPDTMKVTQWWDGPHTKQHLRGHRDKYRQLLIDELSSRRAAWTDPKLSKVGLITFKEFVPYFKEALAEAGFDKTHREVDYYWNVRGSNSFTDCDLLVIIGYPIPNPQGLYGYRAFGGFRGDNLQSWLLRIVANTCRDMLRARKVRPSISLDAQSMDPEHPTPIELPSSAESPEEYTLRRELGNTLQRGLLSLPEEQRLAVVLVDVQGFSYEEAAEIMNCSIGTIRSRLSRGRARVRDFLQMHQELLPHQFRLEKQEYVDS